MDIRREGTKKKKLIKRITWSVIIGIPVLAGLFYLFSLDPAAPTLERNMIWSDSVKQGDLTREVRGLGTLVPEEIRWLAASTQGRVEVIHILAGAIVSSDDVIMELSNPTLMQNLDSARLALESANARLANTQVQLQSRLLEIESSVARLSGEYEQAQLDVEVNEELASEGLLAELNLKQSQVRADKLKIRLDLEKRRLQFTKDSMEPQMATEVASVATAKARFDLVTEQVSDLMVRAPQAGVLQQVPVEEGQQVIPGTNLARVADPSELKAEIRIPETQARDIIIGQSARIDTRNGIIPGRVVRIDPAVRNGTVTVDITLTGELPRGARPDLTVDGTIELEVIKNVLIVQRPVFGRENATTGVFKFDSDNKFAHRVPVQFGKTSVNSIQVVSGLNVGDAIILSETSNYDNYDKIRITD